MSQYKKTEGNNQNKAVKSKISAPLLGIAFYVYHAVSHANHEMVPVSFNPANELVESEDLAQSQQEPTMDTAQDSTLVEAGIADDGNYDVAISLGEIEQMQQSLEDYDLAGAPLQGHSITVSSVAVGSDAAESSSGGSAVWIAGGVALLAVGGGTYALISVLMKPLVQKVLRLRMQRK